MTMKCCCFFVDLGGIPVLEIKARGVAHEHETKDILGAKELGDQKKVAKVKIVVTF